MPSYSFLQRMMMIDWDQEKMLEMVQRMKDVAMVKEYERLYGPDPNSPHDWYPDEDWPLAKDFAMPCDLTKGNDELDTNLKALLLWNTLDNIQNQILKGRPKPSLCLYNPSRYPEGMEQAAYFRQELVIPHYKSVQAFHDHLLQLSIGVERQLAFFSSSMPPLPFNQVVDYFEAKGDDQGAALAKVHHSLYPDWDWDILEWFKCLTTTE